LLIVNFLHEVFVPPLTRKPWWRRWFGNRSERAAARFLKRLGFRILARNFSCSLGEIDIIALDGPQIVFVEVRSTEAADLSRPAASVDDKKQQRLTRLALYYLQKKRLLNHPARFDVLTVSWPSEQREPTIAHVPAAFEATGKFQFFS
jgi:putative endonuclease